MSEVFNLSKQNVSLSNSLEDIVTSMYNSFEIDYYKTICKMTNTRHTIKNKKRLRSECKVNNKKKYF